MPSGLREAFIDAFDFEWTNKKIMYVASGGLMSYGIEMLETYR
jgi:hypothetical protein